MRFRPLIALLLASLVAPSASAQEDPPRPPVQEGQPGNAPRGERGRMPGGPPGMMMQERKLLKEFDANGDGWLNREERDEAREKSPPPERGGPGGGPPGGGGGPPEGNRMSRGGPGGGPGGMGRRVEPATPGEKISIDDVKPESGDLYDTGIIRTLFLDFEEDDWEKELQAFNNSDVDVPARLTVDGKSYESVGVHFRGASSYFMVPAGSKRSLNISMDLIDEDQSLYGFRTLNLLNANGDPSFLRAVLYQDIAKNFLPSGQANFVRVVINGENWGLFINTEQVNRDFVAKHFDSGKGTRWKVPGSPQGKGGLEFLGDDPEPYRAIYSIKNNDEPESWDRLIELCRVLKETSVDELPAALEPILDVDGVLRFLAVENALINSDGYWIRASDYYIYLDEKNIFHLIPHDINEALAPSMGGPGGGRRGLAGPGGRPPDGEPAPRPDGPESEGDGGPPPRQDLPPGEPPGPGGPGPGRGFGPTGGGGNGVALDPLVGLNDATKPLRSKLLAVPEWREKYLGYVREIAGKHLDWEWLGPRVEKYSALIGPFLEKDTKKLTSYADFVASVSQEIPERPATDGASDQPKGDPKAGPQPGPGRPRMTLREFAEARRKFLLEYKPTDPGKKKD
jgi:CotH kinase protein